MLIFTAAALQIQQPQGDVNVINGTLRLTGNEVELNGGATIAIGAALEINN